MAKYVHIYELCVEVHGSTDESGYDVTEEMLASAVAKRVENLTETQQLSEAVGEPVETFEV